MDVTLLRTLTKKSKLGFGRYADLTVQEVLDARATAYIRFLYYNYSGISFTEDILRRVHIINGAFDNRIQKPGTNKELNDKLNGILFNNSCHSVGAPRTMNKIRGRYKVRYKSLIEVEKRKFSKSSLQRINHGH